MNQAFQEVIDVVHYKKQGGCPLTAVASAVKQDLLSLVINDKTMGNNFKFILYL